MATRTGLRKPSAGSYSLRKLYGRAGYFPVSTGASRKYGTAVSPGSRIPPPPASWRGTRPEWAIMYAHFLIGRVPDKDFIYQYDALSDASAKIDFFEVDEQIGIEVQGFFHHYVGYDAFQKTRDLERRIRLEALNIRVVYIDDRDAERDPVAYLKLALRGQDFSRFAKGVA